MMKTYICKNHGEFEAVKPICNKCMTQCPKCEGSSWREGHDRCIACYGAGAAMPGTKEESEMFLADSGAHPLDQ